MNKKIIILVVLLVVLISGAILLFLSKEDKEVALSEEKEINYFDYCWDIVDNTGVRLDAYYKEGLSIINIPDNLLGSETWEEVHYCYQELYKIMNFPEHFPEELDEGYKDQWDWLRSCAKEGESQCMPIGCRDCCDGLISREVQKPYMYRNTGEIICLENMTSHICVNCGDGICGKGENWCICPEDCEKPDSQDLTPTY